MPARLGRPAGDYGEHRFRRVPGDLRHQLRQLGRFGGDVDRAVELVVEPHGTFSVTGGIGVLELILEGTEFTQPVVGDGGRRPGRELIIDVSAVQAHIGGELAARAAAETSMMSRLVTGRTTKPRCGSCSSMPSARSPNSASRTGVTLTPNSAANWSSRT